MTTHPTPAERLLAMIEDEQTFESLPAEEVRADLASVGVDPARCVAFARALAAGTGSPGGRLLGAIDTAEDAEDEIARLESADIDAVRAQIPGATAAAIAAEARRQAGEDGNIVAMRPRRRSPILRWGGPLAGVAASVLLLVVVGVQLLESQLQEISSTTSSHLASANGGDEAAESTFAKDEAPAADVPVARYVAPQAEKQKPAAEPDIEAVQDPLAKQERGFVEAPAPAPAQPVPSAGLMGNIEEDVALADAESGDLRHRQGVGTTEAAGQSAEPETFAARALPAEELSGGRADADSGGAMEAKAIAPAVAAMVILDPARIPLAVQSQAVADAGLAGRIDEARRLAAGRPVIALYRVETGAARQDFAQVPLQAGLSQQFAAPTPLTRLLGPDAGNYDFIALP